MNKISAQGIQLFVGGAVAMNGFDSLFSMFYYLIYSHSHFFTNVIAYMIAGLMLPLGIGILTGRAKAVKWTVIFLWIVVAAIFTAVPLYCYNNPSMARVMVFENLRSFLLCVILLILVYWSRSPRFQGKISN